MYLFSMVNKRNLFPLYLDCYKIQYFFGKVFFERFLPLNWVSRVFNPDT